MMLRAGPGRPAFSASGRPKLLPKFCGILSATADNGGMTRGRKPALALALLTGGASALAETGGP